MLGGLGSVIICKIMINFEVMLSYNAGNKVKTEINLGR